MKSEIESPLPEPAAGSPLNSGAEPPVASVAGVDNSGKVIELQSVAPHSSTLPSLLEAMGYWAMARS